MAAQLTPEQHALVRSTLYETFVSCLNPKKPLGPYLTLPSLTYEQDASSFVDAILPFGTPARTLESRN